MRRSCGTWRAGGAALSSCRTCTPSFQSNSRRNPAATGLENPGSGKPRRTRIANRHLHVPTGAGPSEEIADRISSEPRSGSESEWSSGFSRNPAVRARAYDDCHFHWAYYDLTKNAGLGQDASGRQKRHCHPGSRRDLVKVAKSDGADCVIESSGRGAMAQAMPPRAGIAGLLDFDFSADVFKFFLDRGCFVLVYALFDRLGGAVNQVLGFLRPRLVTSRTALMTLILFAPTSV